MDDETPAEMPVCREGAGALHPEEGAGAHVASTQLIKLPPFWKENPVMW